MKTKNKRQVGDVDDESPIENHSDSFFNTSRDIVKDYVMHKDDEDLKRINLEQKNRKRIHEDEDVKWNKIQSKKKMRE